MSHATPRAILRTLRELSLDLSADLVAAERLTRVACAVRALLVCDAVALLRLEGRELVPVAAEGLVPEALGQRFPAEDHPRLATTLAGLSPVRFPDDGRPDPFDGLLAHPVARRVHSCIVAPLVVEGAVVGVLACDAVAPGAFLDVDDELLATLAALAAAALRVAGLAAERHHAARRCGDVVRELVAEVDQRAGGELLGVSAATARLRREIELTGRTDLAVLVTGETGVGKEVVARAIHARSPRARRPLLYVNCAALPESVAESELFGHVRGAFTGALETRAGKFEAADGGTLFLDEVGELPPTLQPKLLRALQFGEIQRVGADRSLRVDVRVLAASNRDLDEEVAAGRFRSDLFHRLNVYPIHVPALRERPEDILVLAGHFLDAARSRLGLRRVRLTAGARAALTAYDWPGNVRELDHALLRGALRAGGTRRCDDVWIDAEHLQLCTPTTCAANVVPLRPPVDDDDGPLREATDEFQRARIEQSVRACGGNWAAAARRLGLNRGNLLRLAKRLGMRAEA